jgi:hypothetical protein
VERFAVGINPTRARQGGRVVQFSAAHMPGEAGSHPGEISPEIAPGGLRQVTPPGHSAKSLRQATPPSHSAKSLRQVAPASRSARSVRQVGPPSRSAKSLRQVTPPSHSAKPLRQVTPPGHTANSLRQVTLPRGEGGLRPGEGLRGRWQRRGKTAVEPEGALPSKSDSPRSEPVGLVLPAQAEGLGFGPQIAPAL